jgi:hypothetical protein
LTSAPSVAMIVTRGKRMVEMIIMLMTNEPIEIRGKKKKANIGAPVRVAWYFCIIPRLRRWFATRKESQLLHWQDEGQKELN